MPERRSRDRRAADQDRAGLRAECRRMFRGEFARYRRRVVAFAVLIVAASTAGSYWATSRGDRACEQTAKVTGVLIAVADRSRDTIDQRERAGELNEHQAAEGRAWWDRLKADLAATSC